MFLFEGVSCPYCKIPFTENDIITVCPECGTPHHADCYKQHGRCANEERHAENFEWTPDRITVSAKAPTVTCASCGRENPSGGRYCNYCGASLTDMTEAENGGSLLNNIQENYGELFFRNQDGEVEEISPTESFDDIPVKDWVTYIGNSAGYYLYYFKMQEQTKRKISFTVSAMLFAPIYFLYRKVWWLAALSAVVFTALSAPSVISEIFVPAGITFGLSAASLTTATYICSALLFLFRIFCGLFAVYFYRTSAKSQIDRIKHNASNDTEYSEMLKKKSGPSILAVQTFLVILFAATILATTLLLK